MTFYSNQKTEQLINRSGPHRAIDVYKNNLKAGNPDPVIELSDQNEQYEVSVLMDSFGEIEFRANLILLT